MNGVYTLKTASSVSEGDAKQPLGLYIHVPYCIRKCRYCDFVSYPFETAPECPSAYFKNLEEYIKRAGGIYSERFYIDTVFFGGGTPSAVSESLLCRTLEAAGKAFCIDNAAEISLEANPGTLTSGKLAAYRASGFNRISIGVQSFDDDVLLRMGRIHDSKEALNAVEQACAHFDNVSLDLILGTPGQNEKNWERSMRTALDSGIKHISFYSLQLEEGTPFYEDYRAGKIELPPWEENRRMYKTALYMLKDAGFEHYEVSNAARPGYRCRHNLKYWTMQPYLGLGTAAHSFIDGVRFWEKLEPDAEDISGKSRESLIGDFVFTQLRLTDGMDPGLYRQLFGTELEEDLKDALRRQTDAGMLCRKNGRIAFTAEGLDHTNDVMEDLLPGI